jgi:hypothetical protein
MSDENIFKTPEQLLEAYSNGFQGGYCDPNDLRMLLGELPMPLFGAAAYELEFSGEGKLSLPYLSLLKFDPEFGASERQETGDCYKAGTLVLGKNIDIIENINIGDEVYALDGSFTKVISKKQKISYQPMVKIKTKGSLPLEVTAEHLVLVGRKEESSNADAYSNISIGKKTIVKKWIPAAEIQKGDYLITPTKIQTTEKPENKYTKHKDFIWFLGYFLGDGWCDNEQIEITFAKHEVKNFEKCKIFLEEFGFNVRSNDYKNKNAFRLRCWCPDLANFMRSISYKNKSKQFPSWAIGDKYILQGLIETDGFKTETKETFDSSSASLAFGVYYSYLSMGYNPTISYFHRSKKGSFKTSKPAYRVTCIYKKQKKYSHRINDDMYIYVSSIEVKEGPNIVYDIGVAHKDHAFIANGVISHNCVSHSTRNAVDVSRSVEIDINSEPESFEARGATEAIYGIRGHGGQGMSCSQAVRFINQDGGVLLRKKYEDVNLDLSKYSPNIGIRWGSSGVPKSVKELAQKHQVKTISLVQTVAEARDSIANGYALTVCSDQGFSSTRDENGIANPQGSWSHAMCWCGCDDTRKVYNETLFLIVNSWGVWNAGPKKYNQPEGSFWIRQSVAERMLAQRGAFAVSNFDGFPARRLPNYGFGEWL